jgi:hypothetical protein
MNDHDFIIQHKKGSEMPADFLSQSVVSEINVSAINIFEKDLKTLQPKTRLSVVFLTISSLGKIRWV